MKWAFKIVFAVIFLAITSAGQSAMIKWEENFEKAEKAAKEQNKPLLILFSGSDWCYWCQKMDKDIFKNDQFIQEVDSFFVFYLADFPRRRNEFSQTLKTNNYLKEKYEIAGFPTLVILDLEKNVIVKMGYQPIGGQKYGKNLKKIVTQYGAIQEKITQNISEEDLERLYQKAKKIQSDFLVEKIFDLGVKKGKGPFFLLEKYIGHLNDKVIDRAHLQKIREEIEDKDPQNRQKARSRLALIDFQELAKSSADPDKVIEPLLKYLVEFGKKDKDNLWKMELMVAEYLFSKGKIHSALEHARSSYKAAPKVLKRNISDTILYLKKKNSEILS